MTTTLVGVSFVLSEVMKYLNESSTSGVTSLEPNQNLPLFLLLFVSLKRGALPTRAPQAGPSLSPKLRHHPSERGPLLSTLRRKIRL